MRGGEGVGMVGQGCDMGVGIVWGEGKKRGKRGKKRKNSGICIDQSQVQRRYDSETGRLSELWGMSCGGGALGGGCLIGKGRGHLRASHSSSAWVASSCSLPAIGGSGGAQAVGISDVNGSWLHPRGLGSLYLLRGF